MKPPATAREYGVFLFLFFKKVEAAWLGGQCVGLAIQSYVDLFLGSYELKSSVTLVNNVMFILNYLF